MKHPKLIALVAGASLAVAGTSVALAGGAHSAAVPSKVTIKQKQSFQIKANRFFKDTLRWDRDVYKVKSGGTLHVVDSVVTEGPHTLTVVAKKDLPNTVGEFLNCKICETLGQAHGANPESEAPPTFQYLEDGQGQNTAPDVNKAGDSGVVGEGKKGESIDLKVTAKKGTTLYFMCLIHAQMQAKVIVG